jgi:hypothetical protein
MGSAAALAGAIALWSERVVDPEIQRTAPRQARAVSST